MHGGLLHARLAITHANQHDQSPSSNYVAAAGKLALQHIKACVTQSIHKVSSPGCLPTFPGFQICTTNSTAHDSLWRITGASPARLSGSGLTGRSPTRSSPLPTSHAISPPCVRRLRPPPDTTASPQTPSSGLLGPHGAGGSGATPSGTSGSSPCGGPAVIVDPAPGGRPKYSP